MPPYLASAQYKSALGVWKCNRYSRSGVYHGRWMHQRMIQVSMTLNDNKLEAQGLEVALDATKSFPDNYGVWGALSMMKSATEEQKAQALAQMKRLDPLNPNLK
jgi:hypothetical protein